MGKLRLDVPIAPVRVLDDRAAERTLREISARFLPGLESQVGPVQSRDGDHVRVIWTTEGWLPDETFVALSVDVGGSTLQLNMDTAFPLRPPAPPSSRAYTAAVALSLILAGSAAIWQFHAFWPTIGVLFAVVIAWLVPDILLQERKESRAERRELDAAAWRQRLIAAMSDSRSPRDN